MRDIAHWTRSANRGYDLAAQILRNHGLLTVGETVAEAFVAMYYLEASCAILVRAQ
jgi:ribulose-5-phosphate 4-epimerase/fuculose-1-phosphate aldolase